MWGLGTAIATGNYWGQLLSDQKKVGLRGFGAGSREGSTLLHAFARLLQGFCRQQALQAAACSRKGKERKGKERKGFLRESGYGGRWQLRTDDRLDPLNDDDRRGVQ